MRPPLHHLALATLAAAPTVGLAAPQELVVDINTSPPSVNPGSGPDQLTVVGGTLYFAATDLEHGRELWSLTPPATQPSLVIDINPGSVSSAPIGLTELADGRVLFAASTPQTGQELWVTDGTASGTQLVLDIKPGSGSSLPSGFTRHGDQIFFYADDGVHGLELWRSDGTAAGTALAGEFEVGLGGADAFFQLGDLASNGTTLLFSGHVDGSGWSLWGTDGTVANSVKLADLGNTLFEPVETVVQLGDLFVFAARDAYGMELWSSDGTAAGTGPIVDLNPVGDANPSGLVAAGGKVFFAATEPNYGTELWVTDGTAAGTTLVADLTSGGLFFDSSFPEPIGVLGDRLVFSASSPNTGREPLITDGTQAGTQFLGDLAPLSSSSIGTLQAINSAELNGELLFPASDGSSGTELWATDGTPAGTRPVADVNPGPIGSFLGALTTLGGQVWFSADDGVTGREFHVTDGTTAGTALVADLFEPATSVGSEPQGLARLGNRVLFSADDGVHGREPWITDGTAAGTELFLDLYPGPEGSLAQSFEVTDDWALFLARTPEYGLEPWVTDGTPEGTQLLKDFFAGPIDGFWSSVGSVEFKQRRYFNAITEQGSAFWVTDGTPEGTELFFGDGVGFQTLVQAVTVDGDWMYFAAQDGASALGVELYRTNGDPASTTLVADLAPGPWGALAVTTEMAALGGEVYFAANETAVGTELYRSDGTAAGTGLVVDLLPGTDSGAPRELTVLGDRLLFIAVDGTSTTQVFATDGTAAGTEQLTFAPLGVLIGLDANGELAFFRQKPSGEGTQLWVTDGTVAGTQFVETLSPSTVGADYFNFQQIASGPTMLFPNNDGITGSELWSTDGTAAGTDLLFDIAPGGAAGQPKELVRLAGTVLFVANDGATGRELFAAPLPAIGEWVAETYGVACGATAPTLDASVAPLAGAPFDLSVDGATPLAIGALAIGLAQTVEPLLGECQLFVAEPFALLAPFATDATGRFDLPILLGPELAGLAFDAQAVVIDGGGLNSSAGLEVVLGP